MKSVIKSLLVVAVATIALSSCVEHRYYREHHRHSPEWERRHHPRTRIDVDIHN